MYLDKLEPPRFSANELADYFNDFNETSETEVGTALLDAVAAIRASLHALDDRSVVLLWMG